MRGLQLAVVSVVFAVQRFAAATTTPPPTTVFERGTHLVKVLAVVYGCPRVYYWDNTDGCEGTYDYITDSSWQATAATGKVVTFVDDVFYCCSTTDYDTTTRECSASHSSGADEATCVYEYNFCPTLTVDTAASCLGNYVQQDGLSWRGVDDPDCTLQEESRVLKAYRLGVLVGSVEAHTCHNSEVSDPLVYGWNKVHPNEEDTYVFYTKRMNRPRIGVIPTLPFADYPLRVWLWGDPVGQDKGVVLLQLHSKDPKGAYVAVTDVYESTFKMRVVTPAGCPRVESEDVSMLFLGKGVYTGDGGQTAEAGWGTVTVSDGGTFVPFSTTFGATPVVLTTMRENTGALQDFIHSRIVSVNATGFTVVLETEHPHTALDPSWSATVNFFAMHTAGEITGLFSSRKYFAYLSGPGEQISSVVQEFTYPSRPDVDNYAIFGKAPDVFVASQEATDSTPAETRLTETTDLSVSFTLTEETCTGLSDNNHTDNVFGVIAFAAHGEKYKPPTTSTTTTTTTTTTTMTTTVTTTTTTTATTTTTVTATTSTTTTMTTTTTVTTTSTTTATTTVTTTTTETTTTTITTTTTTTVTTTTTSTTTTTITTTTTATTTITSTTTTTTTTTATTTVTTTTTSTTTTTATTTATTATTTTTTAATTATTTAITAPFEDTSVAVPIAAAFLATTLLVTAVTAVRFTTRYLNRQGDHWGVSF